MPDTVVTPPSEAPPKPKIYRCPNGSYTITEAMCQGRQLSKFHLCPRCQNRASLPQAIPSPSPN